MIHANVCGNRVAPRRVVSASVVVLAVAFTAPPSSAVEPGARVRVTILARASGADSLFERAGVSPGKKVVGSYLFSDANVIELEDAKGVRRAIPQEVVALFEESDGRNSRARRGALIGFLAGAAAGVGFGVYHASSEPIGRGYDGFVTAALGVGGGLVGCGLGALIGSQIRTERWSSVRTAQEAP